MLRSLGNTSCDVELRLFAADCAARVLPFLTEPEFSAAICASREYAIGNITPNELDAIVSAAASLLTEHVIQPSVRDFAGSAVVGASSSHPPTADKVWNSVSCALQAVACAAAELADDDYYDSVYDSALAAEMVVQSELLRTRMDMPRLK
ncbi:hypothetical protein [Rhodopirellula sp. SWK7]|uniref:hypothetical protein n=1 Tax=Rhodopirellula sp. SWK7 TaxID=595460 RepID=UPI0005C4769C|nr:hypothetical protein [Rhodopirellula sp. SWK7]